MEYNKLCKIVSVYVHLCVYVRKWKSKNVNNYCVLKFSMDEY